MPYQTLLKRTFAQLIDFLVFYFGYQAFYEIVNTNQPMACDRLFNGVGEYPYLGSI